MLHHWKILLLSFSVIIIKEDLRWSNVYFSFRVLFLFLSEHQSICKFDINDRIKNKTSNFDSENVYPILQECISENSTFCMRTSSGFEGKWIMANCQLVLFILQISTSSSSKVNKIRGTARLSFPRHLSVPSAPNHFLILKFIQSLINDRRCRVVNFRRQN